MKTISRLIALFLCVAMLLGMVPAVFAADGAPTPTDTVADEQWEEIQNIISQYYGEWTTPNYPGAVNNRIPNTALLGNGDVGISSMGSTTEKGFNISKGDFWEYNNSPMKVGDITIGAPSSAEDDGSNLARKASTVTASSGDGKLAVNGRSTAINDGYTGWVTDSSTPQWLALEFDEAITFNTWTIRSYGYCNDRVMYYNTNAAELQVSEDGSTWTTISRFTGNASSVKTVVMDEMVTTNYVRLLVTVPTQTSVTTDTTTRIPQFILSVTEVEEEDEVKNLALDYKNVTASSTHEAFTPDRAVNGEWAENVGYEGWVSLHNQDEYWLALEFEEAITFERFVIRNDGAGRPNETANNTKDCQLQISEDGSEWETIYTVTGNTENVIDITLDEKVTTKYVRLYITAPIQGTSNPRARIGAFELYNMPEVYGVNIAPTYSNVSASSTHEAFAPNRAVNGEWAEDVGYEGWVSTVGNPQWMVLEFAKEITFDRFVIRNDGAGRPNETANNTKACQIQISENGTDWETVYTITNNTENTIDVALPSKVTTKWVRLYVDEGTQGGSNPRARIGAFELYNMPPKLNNVNLVPDYESYKTSTQHESLSAETTLDGSFTLNCGAWGWSSAVGNPQWLMVNMGEEITFNRWVVHNDGAARPKESQNNTKDCQLQIWTGEGTPTGDETEGWTDVDQVVGNSYNTIDRRLGESVTAQYIRLYITKGTQETTSDSRNNPRGRIAGFELYNMDTPAEEKGENLAPNANVYVCDINSEGEAGQYLADGTVSSSKWCCTKDCGTHYAILDLKDVYTLTSYYLFHSGLVGEHGHNTGAYEIQYLKATEDMTEAELKAATNWKTAATVTGNTADQTFGDLEVTARYVRLWLTQPAQGNSASRIHEFEVYGYKASQNIAVGKPMYVCNYFVDNGTPWPGSYMNDGVIDSLKWCCVDSHTHYAIVDLGVENVLTAYKLVNAGQVGENIHNTSAFKIEYLTATEDMTEDELKAATGWKTAVEVTDNTATVVEGEITETSARYVRLWLTDPTVGTNGAARIHEWELYGYEGTVADSGSEEEPPAEEEPETEAPIAYNEKEDILNAQVITEQNLNDANLHIESWMSATNNLFVMEITSLNELTDANISINLEGYVSGSRPTSAEVGDDYLLVTRSTLADGRTGLAEIYESTPYISKVAMATRVIGVEGIYEAIDDALATVTVTVPAGETIYVVTAICGGGRTYTADGALWEGRTEPNEEALALLNEYTTFDAVDQLHEAHLNWWKEYWMQSYISLDTTDADLATLQKYYYAAQYLLGSGIREGNIAAGLYGIWHTNDTPSWHSDYHLNYNFISTYYGLATSNRTSMLLPAVDALMQYLPQGEKNATSLQQLRAVYSSHIDTLISLGQVDAENGIEGGILYPVAIGPWGMTLENNSYHHETVNAPFSAYPLIEYYNFTQDKQFMEDTLYVYLKHVLTFAEAWFIEEDGAYTLYAGYNEGSWSKNPALELSVYKMCLKYGIEIGTELGEDADTLAKWQKMYDGLADQPVVENYNGTGMTVLALAEMEYKNGAWVTMTTPVPGDGNCIPLESIIPGEVFGYYSSAEDLQILQDTIKIFDQRGGWTQINNFPKLAPTAVNARYDCRTIITGLANAIRTHMKQNMMIDDNVHGIEKAGSTEAINNMMLLSDQGVIKLFGNWLADKDAKFVRLRASGAFVFSAEYDGDTQEIFEGATMYSEAGATATVASLWAEGMTVLDEDGNVVKTTQGTAPNHEEEITYTFETEAGKTYTFVKKISVTGVSLDKTEATLPVGEELQLTATVTPEDADDVTVSWASSDESVATVDQNGKVTAAGKGEAAITVTTVDGGYTAACVVTVTLDVSPIDDAIKAANEAAIGILVTDQAADEIFNGTEYVTSAEKQALTDAIAAAETAKEAAKTNEDVTAAVEALNKAIAAFNAAIKTGTYVPVEGVELNWSKLELPVGCTATLIAVVNPETATIQGVTWESSDPSVLTVEADGTVTALSRGEVTVTVTTADGEYSASCIVTVTLDTTAIDTSISIADAAKADIEVIDDKTEDEVAEGTKFVTSEEMKALTDAIAAAEAAKEAAKTNEDVATAVYALDEATDAFNKAVKTGAYVEEEPEDEKPEDEKPEDEKPEDVKPEDEKTEDEEPEKDEPTGEDSEKKPEDEENPKTGDNLWVNVVAMLSSAAALPVLKRRNRK